MSPPRWNKCDRYLKGERSPDESMKMTQEKMPANHLPGSENLKPPNQGGTALSPSSSCCQAPTIREESETAGVKCWMRKTGRKSWEQENPFPFSTAGSWWRGEGLPLSEVVSFDYFRGFYILMLNWDCVCDLKWLWDCSLFKREQKSHGAHWVFAQGWGRWLPLNKCVKETERDKAKLNFIARCCICSTCDMGSISLNLRCLWY